MRRFFSPQRAGRGVYQPPTRLGDSGQQGRGCRGGNCVSACHGLCLMACKLADWRPNDRPEDPSYTRITPSRDSGQVSVPSMQNPASCARNTPALLYDGACPLAPRTRTVPWAAGQPAAGGRQRRQQRRIPISRYYFGGNNQQQVAQRRPFTSVPVKYRTRDQCECVRRTDRHGAPNSHVIG